MKLMSHPAGTIGFCIYFTEATSLAFCLQLGLHALIKFTPFTLSRLMILISKTFFPYCCVDPSDPKRTVFTLLQFTTNGMRPF
jgi:hypothetical protein